LKFEDLKMGATISTIRPAAKTFEDIQVWQKAHEFVLAVYSLTASFPESETHGLSSLMRRAATSIASSIVAAYRKRTKADRTRCISAAEDSVDESHYYLILIRDLGYAETEALLAALNEVSALLNSYSRSILTSSF
jgi:four helix bundle protein